MIRLTLNTIAFILLLSSLDVQAVIGLVILLLTLRDEILGKCGEWITDAIDYHVYGGVK